MTLNKGQGSFGIQHILLMVLVILPVIGTARFVENPRFILVLKQTLLLGTGSVLFIAGLFFSEDRGGSSLIPLTMVLLLTLGIVSIVRSPYGFQGTSDWFLLPGFVFLYFAGRFVDRSLFKKGDFFRYLSLTLLIISVYALFQFMLDSPVLTIGQDENHRAATFLNRSYMSSFLLFGLPFIIYISIYSNKLNIIIFSHISLIFVLMAFYMNGLKPFFVTAAAGLLVTSLLAGIIQGKDYMSWNLSISNRTRDLFISVIAVSMSGFLFFLMTGYTGDITSQSIPFSGLQSSPEETLTRASAMEMYRSSPLTGAGLGHFRVASRAHQAKLLRQDPFQEFSSLPDHQPGDYWLFLSEGGTVYFFLWAFLLALILFRVLDKLNAAEDSRERGLLICILFTVVCIIIQSFYHSPLHDPVTGGFLFFLLGFMEYRKPSEGLSFFSRFIRGREWIQKTGKAGMMVVVVLVLFLQSATFLSRYSFESAEQIRTADRAPEQADAYDRENPLEEARKQYERSLYFDPLFYPAHIGLYTLYTRTRYRTVAGEDASDERASYHLERARELNPHSAEIPFLQGLVAQRQLGKDPGEKEVKEAISYFRESIQRNPNFGPAYRELGWLMMFEDPGSAREMYEKALRYDGTWSHQERINLQEKRISLQLLEYENRGQYQRALDYLDEMVRTYGTGRKNDIIQTIASQKKPYLRMKQAEKTFRTLWKEDRDITRNQIRDTVTRYREADRYFDAASLVTGVLSRARERLNRSDADPEQEKIESLNNLFQDLVGTEIFRNQRDRYVPTGDFEEVQGEILTAEKSFLTRNMDQLEESRRERLHVLWDHGDPGRLLKALLLLERRGELPDGLSFPEYRDDLALLNRFQDIVSDE